jgi:hypothetical protein
MFTLIRRLGIRDSLRATRDVIRGGGPAGIRVLGVGAPEGLVVMTSEIDLEVKLRNGGTTRLSPGIPLPLAAGWAYRVGGYFFKRSNP